MIQPRFSCTGFTIVKNNYIIHVCIGPSEGFTTYKTSSNYGRPKTHLYDHGRGLYNLQDVLLRAECCNDTHIFGLQNFYVPENEGQMNLEKNPDKRVPTMSLQIGDTIAHTTYLIYIAQYIYKYILKHIRKRSITIPMMPEMRVFLKRHQRGWHGRGSPWGWPYARLEGGHLQFLIVGGIGVKKWSASSTFNALREIFLIVKFFKKRHHKLWQMQAGQRETADRSGNLIKAKNAKNYHFLSKLTHFSAPGHCPWA